jgi:hypothetical protein
MDPNIKAQTIFRPLQTPYALGVENNINWNAFVNHERV